MHVLENWALQSREVGEYSRKREINVLKRRDGWAPAVCNDMSPVWKWIMENVHGTNEKDEGVSADGDRLYKVRSVFLRGRFLWDAGQSDALHAGP